MDEQRSHLPAGERDVADRQGVHQKSGLRFLFGYVHLVVGGGVQNDFWVERGQFLFDAIRVGDVQVRAVKPKNRVAALLEFTNQLDTKLAGTSENYDLCGHLKEQDNAEAASM